MHPTARSRDASKRVSTGDFGQRPAVRRQGLQGVHPTDRHDARPDRAVLPAVERQARALPKTIKADAIRPGQPASLDEARALVARFVDHYNTVRLHSAIGYIAPADFLAGRGPAIWTERDRRLEVARELRRVRRAERYQEATA